MNSSYWEYTFDVTLAYMQRNFEIAIEKVKKELHSWKYIFLTVFGKLTVIKTLCLPKLNHIVTVVPNTNLIYIKELESEFRLFINDNNPSVVDDVTRHMSKKLGGLGMIDINLFWKAIRLSWLRRLINSNATWAKMHRADTFPYTCLLYTSPSPRD